MRILAGLLLIALALPVQAAPARWVSFKTGEIAGYGKVIYQLDPETIQPSGGYKLFQARAWVVDQKQPLVFSVHEALLFLAQMYAVDCAGGRFGSRYVFSNMPSQKKRAATLATMTWVDLKTVPAVAKTVCGGK